MHSPAIERPWSHAVVASWGEQHRCITDWACERYEERLALPERFEPQCIKGTCL